MRGDRSAAIRYDTSFHGDYRGHSVPTSRSRICRRLKRSESMNTFSGYTDGSVTTRLCGGTSSVGNFITSRGGCRSVSVWRYLAGMIRTQRLAQGELHAANSPARPLHSAAGGS
jgi:hypothetical protein